MEPFHPRVRRNPSGVPKGNSCVALATSALAVNRPVRARFTHFAELYQPGGVRFRPRFVEIVGSLKDYDPGMMPYCSQVPLTPEH